LEASFHHFLSPAQEIGRVFADHGKTEPQPPARRHPAVFGEGFRTEQAADRPNIVWVVIDGMSADVGRCLKM